VSSIRHQFSTPENIRMSQFGSRFFTDSVRHLRSDDPVDIGFRAGSYLFLASLAGVPMLRRNHSLQVTMGAEVSWLNPAALARRFPWLNVDGIGAGTCGERGEGWLDGYALMRTLRQAAGAAGVELVADRAVGLEVAGGRIAGVRCAAERIACGAVVNACGSGARALCALAGVELPVHPRKRQVFYFECPQSLVDFPLLVDPSGTYVRPEGGGFICGRSPDPSDDPDRVDFEVDHAQFEEEIWPVLAGRVPAFERLRVRNAWAGHYAYNTWDQNVIVGAVEEPANLYLANGCSGHGLQQAPALGRAIAELIVDGGYRTLDLTRFAPDRIRRGIRIRERNVV
jgi:glycine/D-amino acid oxidase-like deaminating enzyme